jgi:hypothetical protein
MKKNIVEITKGKTGTGLLIENDGYISLDMPQNKTICESLRLNEADGERNLPSKLIFNAIFQKFDTPNANGRVYPEHILKREVEKYQQVIREKRAYAELNHPESGTIDLGRLAMNVIELHWEGKTLVGKLEIPITDGYRKLGIVSTCADMAAHWILSGLRIGVSSRGLGSVEQKNGYLAVGNDFELICFDIVSNNSTPGALIFVDGENMEPFKESVDTSNNGKTLFIENNDKFNKFNDWLNG